MTGLNSLLASLRGQDLESASMHYLRDANEEDFLRVRHVLKLPLIGGGTWDWEIADPHKLLQLTLDRSPLVRGLFEAALRRGAPTATSPWRLVVGFDEFMPGQSVLCIEP